MLWDFAQTQANTNPKWTRSHSVAHKSIDEQQKKRNVQPNRYSNACNKKQHHVVIEHGQTYMINSSIMQSTMCWIWFIMRVHCALLAQHCAQHTIKLEAHKKNACIPMFHHLVNRNQKQSITSIRPRQFLHVLRKSHSWTKEHLRLDFARKYSVSDYICNQSNAGANIRPIRQREFPDVLGTSHKVGQGTSTAGFRS